MPASKPGYNLHPRYNRPILRRQRRNDGRRENTHGKAERRTAGRKTRADGQTTTASPKCPATPETPTAGRPRRWRSAQPATAPGDSSEPVSHAQTHAGRIHAASPAQDQQPQRRRSAAPDAVKAEDARAAPRGRARRHAHSPAGRSAPRVSLFSRISPSRKTPLFRKPKKRKTSFCAFLREIFKKFFLPLSATFSRKSAVKQACFCTKPIQKAPARPHNYTLDGEKTTIFLPWCDKK